MRRWALTVAAIGFFALAIVGWANQVEPLTCGLRALGGAAALFLGTVLALRLALAILVNPAMRKPPAASKDRTGLP